MLYTSPIEANSPVKQCIAFAATNQNHLPDARGQKHQTWINAWDFNR